MNVDKISMVELLDTNFSINFIIFFQKLLKSIFSSIDILICFKEKYFFKFISLNYIFSYIFHQNGIFHHFFSLLFFWNVIVRLHFFSHQFFIIFIFHQKKVSNLRRNGMQLHFLFNFHCKL